MDDFFVSLPCRAIFGKLLRFSSVSAFLKWGKSFLFTVHHGALLDFQDVLPPPNSRNENYYYFQYFNKIYQLTWIDAAFKMLNIAKYSVAVLCVEDKTYELPLVLV